MCTSLSVSVCGCLQRPEKGVGFLGAGVTDSCELPDVGAGSLIQVFGETATLLKLSHFSHFHSIHLFKKLI